MSTIRSRVRQETESAIQLAALRIASRDGIDAATVDAICAEAGVSVRTFFNYFAFKEAAFAVSPPPFGKAAVDAFLAGKRPLLDDLTDLFVAQMEHLGDDRGILRTLREIADRNPRVLAMQLAKYDEFVARLAALIATRLRRTGPDFTSRALAAAATATARVIVDDWAQKSTGSVANALRSGMPSLQQLVQSAVEPQARAVAGTAPARVRKRRASRT